jgi:hypothetical protein
VTDGKGDIGMGLLHFVVRLDQRFVYEISRNVQMKEVILSDLD